MEKEIDFVEIGKIAARLSCEMSRVFEMALDMADEKNFKDLHQLLINLDQAEKRLRELRSRLQELEP